jgi:imidazolonepropionase-like amidohydrolase
VQILKFLTFWAFILLQFQNYAQIPYPQLQLSDHRPNVVAYTNTNIFVNYNTLIKNANILIENGKVIAVGKDIIIPKYAKTINLSGKYITPAFIELHSNYGLPNVPLKSHSQTPQYDPQDNIYANTNDAIKAYQDAYKQFNPNKETAQKLIKAGFGTALTHIQDGIARGTGALVNLCSNQNPNTMIKEQASQHFSFDKGSSIQQYPGSLMGCIALLRQTFYDQKWYAINRKTVAFNPSLAALNKNEKLPKFFEANDQFNVVRANKIAQEFGYQFIIKSNGKEFKNLDAVLKTKAPIVTSINFPKPIDAKDIWDEEQITFAQLKDWELAPYNFKLLLEKNTIVALSYHGCENETEFHKNIYKIWKTGVKYNEIIKSLTYTPALLLNQTEIIGSLNVGAYANFIISSDSLFKPSTTIYSVVTAGEEHSINQIIDKNKDIRGVYSIKSKENDKLESYTLSIYGEIDDLKIDILKDTIKESVNFKYEYPLLSLNTKSEQIDFEIISWVLAPNSISGIGRSKDIKSFNIKLELALDFKDSISTTDTSTWWVKDYLDIGKNIFPFTAYGFVQKPKMKSVLFKNATIYTSENEGILHNTDLFISNGKIEKIGKLKNIKADTIIDGVNECTNNVTSEVRIEDIINPSDVDIYRNLSGGVTAAQLLHGSCNCIGGQSAIVKLKWGSDADSYPIPGTDPFIKFALGENVKQSNFGDNYTSRYPQTRMGVEQVFTDIFNRAKEYENNLKINPLQTRKDLQLDAVLEILNKKRFITCHSYVQSEILMLMEVAERFGIKVNTFTHILEGYKIADKMLAHGAGASTFADWWSYKYEVKDAIPHNAGIMHRVGLTVAINSDNAEMATRLNQEAAKTMKYSNVSAEDALKMITINPAKLLHLDRRTGSIKIGKDADIVLWSSDPLSIYAVVEQTYVEGICLFDRTLDNNLRKYIRSERIRILDKMKKDITINKSETTNVYFSPHIQWECGSGSKDIH